MKVIYVKVSEGHSAVLIFKNSSGNSCEGCIFTINNGCMYYNSEATDYDTISILNIVINVTGYYSLPCTISPYNGIILGKYDMDMSIYLSRYLYNRWHEE